MLLVIVVNSYLQSRAFSCNLYRDIWLILMRICSMRICMFAWSPGRQEARLLLVDRFFGFAVLHFPLACLFPFPPIPISFPFLRLLQIFLSLPLWSPSHSLARRPLKIVACLYFFICSLCRAFAPPQSCCCKGGRGLGITGRRSILTFSFLFLLCFVDLSWLVGPLVSIWKFYSCINPFCNLRLVRWCGFIALPAAFALLIVDWECCLSCCLLLENLRGIDVLPPWHNLDCLHVSRVHCSHDPG